MAELGEEAIKHTLNAILVVAVLIATVTFQAGLNPPGGFWQDGNSNPSTNSTHGRPGLTVNEELARGNYMWFMVFNNLGLTASVCVIILVSIFRLRASLLLRVASALTTLASISMITAYSYGLRMINETKMRRQALYWSIPICVLGIIIFGLAFAFWERFCNSKKRETLEEGPRQVP